MQSSVVLTVVSELVALYIINYIEEIWLRDRAALLELISRPSTIMSTKWEWDWSQLWISGYFFLVAITSAQ